jgi:hypothetical protein
MQVSTFFLSILPVTFLMVLFSKILLKDLFFKHVFIRFLSHALLGLFGLIRANITYEKTFP